MNDAIHTLLELTMFTCFINIVLFSYHQNGLTMCCLLHNTHSRTTHHVCGLFLTLTIVHMNSRHQFVVCCLVYRLHDSALLQPFFELLRASLHHKSWSCPMSYGFFSWSHFHGHIYEKCKFQSFWILTRCEPNMFKRSDHAPKSGCADCFNIC